MRIQTSKNILNNKSNNLTLTYKKTLNPSSKYEIDFIKECSDNKCIGIYSDDMYPLIQSNNGSNFSIIKIKDERFTYYAKNYILEYICSNIVAIYNSNGVKIFSANEDQIVDVIPTPYSLIINIAEINKATIVYDVLKSKEIIKGSYCNTLFLIKDDFYFETEDNKIKAIYSNNRNLILKSDLGYFKFINCQYSSSIKYILECSYNNERCYTIFQYDSIISLHDYLYSDEDLSLSIYSYNKITDCELIITGSINDQIKKIVFINSQKNVILRENTLDINDERWYYTINKQEKLIQIFFKNKCIKILNYNFETIVSVNPKNSNCIQETYLVIDEYNSYIKKIRAGKCIAYYNYDSEEVIKTKRNDINIVACNCKNNEKLFLFIKDNECIKIHSASSNKVLKAQRGITYEILKDYNNMLMCGYIVKDGKKIGIFDFNLNTVVKFNKDYSVKIFVYDTYNKVKEDFHGQQYPELSIKLIYLKYDSDGKCRKILNELNETLHSFTDKSNYFKPLNNNYILIFNNNKCKDVLLIKNFKTYNIAQLREESQILIPYLTKQGYTLFKVYDTTKHKYVSLFIHSKGELIELINSSPGGYEHIYTINEFLLVSSNHNKSLQLINLKDLNKDCNNNNLYTSTGYFKLEFINKDFVIIYKIKNKKITSVYLVSELGFNEVITAGNITPVYIENNIFFNVAGNLYNKVGNLII